METYEDIYEKICRICLLRGDSENMVSLIDKTSADGLSSYGKAVRTFAQIAIEKEECLPQLMCYKCLLLLKQAIYFKLTCESSDRHLRNILETVRSNMQVLKEKVVEFIMFRQMFPKSIDERSAKPSVYEKKERKYISEEKNSVEIDENLVLGFDSDHADSNYFDIQSSDEQNILQSSEFKNDKSSKQLEYMTETNLCPFDSAFKLVKRKKKVSKDRRAAKKSLKFVCPICEKVLTNHNTYDCHMQRHNGFRYICEHCGKGYPCMNELQTHQFLKHGTGPHFQCNHCPFKTARKFDLIEHLRLHTGERPFACEKCGLTFRRRGILKSHLLHHFEKTVQCERCPRKFYQRSEMLAHCNNVHERRYMYACSKCCATYAKTATVRRHMAEKHEIPREMQGKVLRIYNRY